MSKVAIIGHGNVGYHLAKLMKSIQHEVTVFTRSPSTSSLPLDQLNSFEGDFVIVCVTDHQVKHVSNHLPETNAIVLHTSGSRPLQDLSNHKNHGVLYPLQTFSKTKEVDFTAVPFFVEGSSSKVEKEILNFASTLSNNARLLSSTDRIKLHLAAVFACNFSNHMYHISDLILAEMGMSFANLHPLVKETLHKAIDLHPSLAQTGPAIRNDEATIQSHLKMLEDDTMKEIYQLITRSIQQAT